MEVIKIIGLSLSSMIVLFILTKIMGQREMSQLSIFDYMIAITIRVDCSRDVNFFRR